MLPPRLALRPALLACRQLDDVDAALAAALAVPAAAGRCLGLFTCDQDDAATIAIDEATKQARVEVVFARSFYAGSKHASGPYSGEWMGILAADNPDDVAEALWVVKTMLKEQVSFETFAGEPFASRGGPAFLAHVVAETGSFLAKEAGLAPSAPLAYLIAPPLEATVAVDAALKAGRVTLQKWIPPPSETNFAGAFLSGELSELQAARDAFVEAVHDVATRPLAALRRPDHQRR